MSEINAITVPDLLIVDKKYTRTYHQEDSLLSNLRRTLPKEISVDDFENKIVPNITEEEKQFLLNYYHKRAGLNGVAYFLRTIRQRINVEAANSLMSSSSINDEQRNFVLSFYKLDESQGKYILENSMSEADEIKLMQMFHLKNLHIRNVEKAMISDILEKVPGLHRNDQFYANLYVPKEHKFYSPPNLKHYSGMQLTEAARLMYIATCHKYGGVPFEGITFALLKLNSEYFQYAVLNRPIKYETQLNSLKFNKDNGSWRFCDMTFTAFQDNLEMCKVNVVAAILPLTKYKEAKSEQEQEYEIDPRFKVLDKFKKNISIRYLDDNNEVKKWICNVENISHSGFMIQSEGEQPSKKLLENIDLQFFIHFDIVGFVVGKCNMVWYKPHPDLEDHYFAGFKITEISKIDKENLKEAIGRFGRLIEEREIS